jgi:hypothetical protein
MSRYSTPVIPKAASGKGGKSHVHGGKVKPLPITVQFCKYGRRHYCFRVPDVGWFVLLTVPEKVKTQGGARSWFTVHSVLGVNTSEAVCKYIQMDIGSGADKKAIARDFQMRALNGELDNYHEKTQEYEQRQNNAAKASAAANTPAPNGVKAPRKGRAEWGSYRDHD